MDRVYTSIDFLLGIVFLSVTINFAYAIFSAIFTFYEWLIMIAIAYSVGSMTFLLHVWKQDIDYRATDTLTGTLLGAMIILFLNFIFAVLYAQTMPAQSITLSFLQINTGLIVSHLLIQILLICPVEEIVFREVLFSPLRFIFQRLFGTTSFYADGFAYGLSSAVYFAIAHQVALQFNPILILFPIASSVVFVYIRIKYGLYASVNAHRINNIISSIM